MPKYRIELSDGRTFVVEADSPPSEQDVLAALPQAAQEPATPQGDTRKFRDGRPVGIGRNFLTDFVRNNPAQAGAMAAGTLAAPFTGGLSIPASLAAIGGASALGAGAGQAAAGQMPSPRTMLKEGALGAGGQMLGRGVTGVLRKVAPVIARAVLKPGKPLQQEFGADTLVETFLKEGVPVGQSSSLGPRIAESADKAKNMIAQATAQGAPAVRPSEIVSQFRPVMDEAKRRAANAAPDAASQMQEIVGRAKALRAQGPTDLATNQTLKQQAQRDASAAFRAQDKGAVIKDTTAKLDKAVAVGRQRAAETRVPGIRDVNRQTQSLMGLEEALTDAEARNPGLVGINPLQWLGAMMPGTGSKVAFGVNRAAESVPFGGIFRNALLALLGSEQEPNRP